MSNHSISANRPVPASPGPGDLKPKICVSFQGAIGILTISNPRRRNAFTTQMLIDIAAMLKKLDKTPEVKAIVIEGDGDLAFASGDDISEVVADRTTPEGQRAFMAIATAAFNAPAECSKPVVAAISGFCFGGAMQLVSACDVRICGKGARFSVPAVKIGAGYPMWGVARFVDLIGAAGASKILLGGQIFSCEELLPTGFISEMVADADVKMRAYTCADELSERAPLSVRAIKRAIAAYASGDAPARTEALALIAACQESEDYHEGHRAFLEKRKPIFKGI